ncbi:MAG: hypothetical protein K6E32_05840 [Lachnospiraceae bacterium]|nr:hypothetical protein [Lachnospiraceae bacterium]
MSVNRKPVDVICEFSRDGTIIPIKIRTADEDGEYQTYIIKEYRDLSHRGTRSMPDGVYVTDETLIFECNIIVFGCKKLIRLYYKTGEHCWIMTAG